MGNHGKADFISILKEELPNSENFPAIEWTPSKRGSASTRQYTTSEEK